MWESLAYMTWCFIFLIFLSICRSCNFSLSKCFVFWVYAGLRDLRFTKPAYTQKNQHFDAKSAKNLHILKKSKVLIVKSHQTCIYSKNQKNQKSQTLCGTHWHRWLGFWFSWFFWVYAGLVTFPYQNVWLFWVYAGLRDLRFTKPAYTQKKQHFDAKNAQSLHILKNIKSFDSEKSPNLHILKKSKKSKISDSMWDSLA